MTRKPRKLDEHLVSGKLLCHAYGNMGEIATAGGFFAYFTVMQVYGFPYNVIFGLVSVKAYNPQNDLNYNIYQPFNTTQGLAGIYQGIGNGSALACDGDKDNTYVPVTGFPDWLSLANNKVDLRTAYLNCVNGSLTPRFNFSSDCDRPNDISSISGKPTCFSV